METIMSFARYILMILVAGLLTPFISPPVISLDKTYLDSGAGFDINLADAGTLYFVFAGILAFILILAGEQIRYRSHILILLVLLFITSISIDPIHFYFPSALIIFGAVFGWFVRVLISNIFGKMPQVAGWKKYF